jgi:hypothetical protein
VWDGATFTNWQGESDVWTIEEGAFTPATKTQASITSITPAPARS